MDVMLNGQSVSSWFNSGSNETTINVAAAKLLGITQNSPHLKSLLPDDISPLGRLRRPSYEVNDVPVTIGSRHLIVPRILVFGSFDAPSSEKPYIQFGSEAFSDRRMLISYSTRYSTRQFCLVAS
jgi:hypothetical protein